MQIEVAGRSVNFEFDENREAYVTPFNLPAWAGYRSENSQPDLIGDRVLFILEPEVLGSEKFADTGCYERGIAWFLAHQDKVQASALAGISAWISTLRDEYGIDDEELNAFSSSRQLTSMVDLSFARIYPQSKGGLPYFGLEFECNWDPEHGCGLMFYGATVVDAGVSDSAQGAFDIAGDGGGV
jgi:hypothetical protein